MKIMGIVKVVWEPIRKGLMLVGKVQSMILLSLFYYLVLGPVAIISAAVRLLAAKKQPETYWVRRPEIEDAETELLRQF